MNANINVLKRSGKKEEFSRKKLEYSLLMSGATKEQAKKITEQVYTCCSEGMTTQKIFQHAFRLLKKENKVLAVQYSLPKAIHEMGPDGFNFEKLIGAMFTELGHKVSLDNEIYGKCVKHEVDVIARKKGSNIYCECKFHNSPGTKNDLKTALYVYARYLDLKNNPANEVSEFWLISNTKFSRDAIAYAECVGLKLLGPNFPHHNALSDMARRTHIHPITCLTSLKKNHAKKLMEAGIILTSDLLKSPEKIKILNLSQEQHDRIFLEIKNLQRIHDED